MSVQNVDDNSNIKTQQTSFGIGRIIVFIAIGLACLAFFLPWWDLGIFGKANAFAVFHKVFQDVGEGSRASWESLLGLIFLVFIFPTWIALAKKQINLPEQIGGFLCAVAGIITGIIFVIQNQETVFGHSVNTAGAGAYVFLCSCVALIVGIALYNYRPT